MNVIENVEKESTTSIPDDTLKLGRSATLSDTLFIYRSLTTDCYHAIYIDTTHASKQLSWLTDFSFDESDHLGLISHHEYWEERDPGSFRKQHMHGLSKEWLPVHPYKGNYYLYAPSDWGNAGRRILTDSSFIYWYMDGPTSVPIRNVIKKDRKDYSFEIRNFGSDEFTAVNLTVIDPITQLTLFEFTDEAEAYRYRLYVPVSHLKHFDLIINHCETQKQREFQFEKLDINTLIRKHSIEPR
jgi:hypothetical protein